MNTEFISAHKEMELSPERFKSLSRFCSKYRKWEDELYGLVVGEVPVLAYKEERNRPFSNPTEKIMELKHQHLSNMNLIRETCYEADPLLWWYLFLSVTTIQINGRIGLPYYILKIQHGIPCTEEEWRGARRRFFYLLSKKLPD